MVAVGDIADGEADKIASGELAVDGQVEQCEVADVMGIPDVNSDCPDVLELRLLAQGNRIFMS